MSAQAAKTVFDWLYKAVRWGLGCVFIYAGSMKLVEPTSFALLINAYGIVPEILLIPVAIALPALEVFAGAGLIFDMKGSLGAIAAMLGLFIAILGYGIWMGLDVDCGCFGPEDPKAKAFHGLRLSLHRDFGMAAAVVFLYGWRRYRGITPSKIKGFINKRRPEDAYV